MPILPTASGNSPPSGTAGPTAANPPLNQANIKVLVDGHETTYISRLVSIETESEFNRISSAELVFLDGDVARQGFEASSSAEFTPGKTVEIQAGYQGNFESIFKGDIIKHGIKVLRDEPSALYLSLRNKAYRLTMTRTNRLFPQKKDSEAFEEILGDHSIDREIEATTVQHENIVQFNSSDWDFINMRAGSNGMFVYTHPDKVIIRKPDPSVQPEFSLGFGSTIKEFEGEIDGRTAFQQYKAETWNYKDQELKSATQVGTNADTRQGNLPASDVSGALNNTDLRLQVNAPMNNANELDRFAESQVIRNNLSRVKGRLKCHGNAHIEPGKTISLQGVGDRFNGNALVSSVHHSISSGTWETEIWFGISDKTFAENFTNISAPKASSMLPAIHGLQIAVVDALADPAGEHRIKVRLPAANISQEGIWARVCTLDAGDKRGSFFLPEIGDEVILGFIDDDPRAAVVIGMLNSSAKPAPLTAADQNNEKGFVTRSNIKMIFNDENKSLSIETPAGKKLALDEAAGTIRMEDEHNNKIVMDSNGITIESAGKIELKADKDLNLQGLNVSGKGNASLKMEGSSSAEVSTSGSLTLKGSMVQIN